MPELLEVTVESLDAQGMGLARSVAGERFRVARSAPGDLLHVEREGDGWARLVEVLHPGPNRVEPPCPAYRAGCGGCTLQHLSVPAQRSHKVELAAQVLGVAPERLSLRSLDPPSGRLGDRQRARLQAQAGRVGFHRRHSAEVLQIEDCLLFGEPLAKAYEEVRHRVPEEVTGLVLHATVDGRYSVSWNPRDRAIGVPAPGAAWLEDAGFWIRADAFAQADRRGTALLVDAVLEACGDASGPVLELGAGIGTLTLPLSARFGEVIAVEPAGPGFDCGVRNAAGRPIRYRTDPVDGCALIVADPPREGFGPLLAGVLSAARRVVHISCGWRGLGRDAAVLRSAGFQWAGGSVLDIFPHAAHAEVVTTWMR